MTCSTLTACSPERPLYSAGVLSKPGDQIGGAGGIQQRFGHGLQLLQRQSLDAGGGGLAQGAAAEVELADGDIGGLSGTATGFALGFAFLPAPIQKVLGGACVEQLVGGDSCDHHDLLGSECGKPLKQHSENGGQQIWLELENLLGAALELRFWPSSSRLSQITPSRKVGSCCGS